MIAVLEIERFRSESPSRAIVSFPVLEILLGLRNLVTSQIAQNHLLGLILERDAETVLLESILFSAEEWLQLRKSSECVREKPGFL